MLQRRLSILNPSIMQYQSLSLRIEANETLQDIHNRR
jgi:hypothetical protein